MTRLTGITAGALLAVFSAAQAETGTAEQPLQVQMAPAVQARAGLQTAVLEAATRHPEMRAVAEVLALAPLLADRAAVIEARAAVDTAEARLAASRAAYERLHALAAANAGIAQRKVAEARARRRVDAAQLAAAEARLANLRAGFVQAWGEALAQAAFAEDYSTFDALLQGEAVLVRLTLPVGVSLPEATERVWLARRDARNHARAARVVAPAPATGEAVPGETWLLRTAAQGLRVGMRLYAWVPMGDEPRKGVLLPTSAVVWLAGRPWAYVQTGETRFVRRPVDATETGLDFWFVADGFAAGEQAVTTGAQLLLGQDLRARIPSEDDD